MGTSLVFVVFLAGLYYVLRPLFKKRIAAGREADKMLAQLYNKRDMVLARIKESEFDHAMGKLTKQDFESMNAEYRLEAVNILRQIEERMEKNSARASVELEIERMKDGNSVNPS